MGAGPRSPASKPLPTKPPDDDFPIPPIPPVEPPAYQAAPMPDTERSAPALAAPRGTQIRPDFYSRRFYNGGQGYLPGSTIEGEQEQRQLPVPELNLKMPLQ